MALLIEPGSSAAVLVALASTGGTPNASKEGNEINVPPPATELIAPPRTAATKSNKRPGRFMIGCWLLDEKLAVLEEHAAVGADSSFLHARDHVPMHCALVLSAGVGVARADCQVDRAADLLVEQDVARELRDAVVGANGKLA